MVRDERAQRRRGAQLRKDRGGLVATVGEAFGVKMRVVETGGSDYMRERTQ